MVSLYEGLQTVLTNIETLEGCIRRSNVVEVESRNRMLDVSRALKELVFVQLILAAFILSIVGSNYGFFLFRMINA